jgi:plastocyanin
MRSHAIRIGVVAAMASAALWGGSGVATAGGGCMHAAGPTTGRGNAVEMMDACFTSTVLYVDRGTDVTWTNRDPMDHNVVGVGGAWGDMNLTLSPGDTVSYRFKEDGVFPYACWIHPGMIGAIVVGDGVGTGLSGVVPAAVADAGAATDEAVTAPIVRDGGSGVAVIWVLAGALLLAGLGGTFAMVTRNRRRGAVAGGQTG